MSSNNNNRAVSENRFDLVKTPIFLLHGLGGHAITLLPLETWLNYSGYSNTHRLSYPVSKLSFDECLAFVDNAMSQVADKATDEVILIGQSTGGVVANAMHRKNWRIKNAIYIGSPLHGARLLLQLRALLPHAVTEFFMKQPYDFLMSEHKYIKYAIEPNHPYHTISMGWGWSDFDGCVYKNETLFDMKNHTHLQWADHRLIIISPRLWTLIHQLLSR